MEKELGKSRAELEKLNTKLHNPGFVNKAPANVVEAERERAERLAAEAARTEIPEDTAKGKDQHQ